MIGHLTAEALATLKDVVPVAIVVAFFQLVVVRRPPANLTGILIGVGYVLLGLTLFRVGLSLSLLPVGSFMAEQLTRAGAARGADAAAGWHDYLWLYLFVAAIGLAATLIEPSLKAVAERVRAITGGAIRPWSLRLVIASGVALGLLLGTLRIVVGFPMEYVVVPLLAAIAILALSAPRAIVPLALDSGAMATSVVTVPMISAFGVTLAATVPGRSPLTDGFGLILLALLLPVVSLLAFAQLQAWQRRPPEGGEKDAV
jgi:hypothetical protein